MKILSFVIGFLALLFMPILAYGAVTGQCSNCHTMHNSQGGAAVNNPAGPYNGGTYDTLLVNGCVGCHSSASSSTTYDLGGCDVPVVNYIGGSEPIAHLAGGNFYWVADTGDNEDAKGHNVLGISGVDAALSAAPGNSFSCANSCHESLAVVQTSSATDLGSGCKGCHLAPAHHAAEGTGVVTGAADGYYRFLSGHMSGNGAGVEGIEDSDWQATVGATDHNEYLGHVANLNSSTGMHTLGNTMSGYCCGCHGNFHNENTQADGSGVWIRHPSDVVIPNAGEYAAYTAYDPSVPVARPTFTGYTGATGTVAPGTDLVMCLSCHRPHGSPYDDLLRWEYSAMDAGTTGAGAGTGCFVCHSNKDGS